MDTQLQKHIETVKEAFDVLHTSGYNHTDLKYGLNLLIDYLQEQQKRELEKERLASIDRDLERLEIIGRNIRELRGTFLELEAEALERQRQKLDKNE